MIKIITAIGNPNLNYDLRKYEDFEVIGKDIQYSEGVLEFLELNNDIDYIIMSEFLEGEIKLINLIDKIYLINKKIKIIIILNEKNIELEDQLLQKGIHNIFYNKSEIAEIVNLLKTKNMEFLNKELREEIEKLKEIISEKNYKKTNKNNIKMEEIKYKTLGIIGNGGVGKSSFCYFISNFFKTKYKILLIDFDLKNNDISTIFNLKKEYIEKENIFIKDLIKKIDDNLDVIFNINFLINYKKYNIEKILYEINLIKNDYDFIFIDTNSNIFLEENKEIYKNCDKLILLTESGKIAENRSQKIEKTIINNFKINKEKINVIFYKFKKIDYLINKNKMKNNIKKEIKNSEKNKKIKIGFMIFYNIYLNNLNLIKIKKITKIKYFLLMKKIQEK